MNGDFAHGTTMFVADLPQEVIDKVLANTKEDMDKWLESGNTFDLSDGADRTVAYIIFPKGTKPEEVVQVVRCKNCIQHEEGFKTKSGRLYCCYLHVTVDPMGYCDNGDEKHGEQ